MPGQACHWIDTWRGTEPFFLEIGIPGPHPPYDPTADVLALYADRDLPEAVIDRADIDSQPTPLKKLTSSISTTITTPSFISTSPARRNSAASVSIILRTSR